MGLAALIVTFVSLTATADVPVPAAPADALSLARQRFARGVELYDAQSWEAALSEFQASLELYESPNTHLYVARCHRTLGHLVDAVVHLERSAALADDRAAADPRYAETRAAARDELRALAPRIARVRVHVTGLPAGAQVWVNAREIPAAGLGLLVPVDPGVVVVRARGNDGTEVRRSIDAKAGQVIDVELAAPPPAEQAVTGRPAGQQDPGRARGAWLWATGATAIIGAGAFLLFRGLAEATHDDLVRLCGPGPCPTDQSALVDRGRRYQALTNGALVVSGVGLVGGLALWLWPSAQAAPVSVGIGPGALSVSGHF